MQATVHHVLPVRKQCWQQGKLCTVHATEFPRLQLPDLIIIHVLFCLFVTVTSPGPCVPGRVLGTVGKLSSRRGAWAWFRRVWTYDGKVIEF